MSAFGGVIGNRRQKIDPQLILNMSRSTMMRGVTEKDAYLNGPVGIFYNGRKSSEFAFQRQPLTLTRNGKNYTLVLDGSITGIRQILSPLPIQDGISPEELILESYLSLGIDFVGALQGSFSLCIWDEDRGEFLFARDREGSRPLFYTTDGESLAFASEIKALFRFLPDAAIIQSERLRAHVISPCGTYRPEELYRNIYALPAGHCGIFSRMGMNIFAYPSVVFSVYENDPQNLPCPLPVPFCCPERDTLRKNLIDALFSFDYPQFDPWMPAVFHVLERLSSQGEQHPIIEDPILCQSISYAHERADRLGACNGFDVLTTVSSEKVPRTRELKKMSRLLDELLEEADHTVLRYLFGKNWQELPNEEKSLEKRIRIQGLLYQSALWQRHYPIRIL